MRPSRIAAINRAHAVRRTARPARDYTLGWRVEPEGAGAPDVSFGLKATRRESDAQDPEHGLGIDLTARW